MNTPDIQHLRQLIENTLAELGMPDANWSCIKAQSFARACDTSRLPPSQVLAVWLADRNEIEFHGENGTLLTTVGLDSKKAEWVEAA